MEFKNHLLNPKQIAEVLNVSTKTVYYWVIRDEIPYLKVGKHLRFNRDKVLKFFEENTTSLKPSRPCLRKVHTLESLADRWSLKTEARTVVESRRGK